MQHNGNLLYPAERFTDARQSLVASLATNGNPFKVETNRLYGVDETAGPIFFEASHLVNPETSERFTDVDILLLPSRTPDGFTQERFGEASDFAAQCTPKTEVKLPEIASIIAGLQMLNKE